jgi:hypothetical protein
MKQTNNKIKKLETARRESFYVANDVYRNISLFMIALLFVKIVFHPVFLSKINISIFLIGIIVSGIARLMLE